LGNRNFVDSCSTGTATTIITAISFSLEQYVFAGGSGQATDRRDEYNEKQNNNKAYVKNIFV
jgi:hypothetical protein